MGTTTMRSDYAAALAGLNATERAELLARLEDRAAERDAEVDAQLVDTRPPISSLILSLLDETAALTPDATAWLAAHHRHEKAVRRCYRRLRSERGITDAPPKTNPGGELPSIGELMAAMLIPDPEDEALWQEAKDLVEAEGILPPAKPAQPVAQPVYDDPGDDAPMRAPAQRMLPAPPRRALLTHQPPTEPAARPWWAGSGKSEPPTFSDGF